MYWTLEILILDFESHSNVYAVARYALCILKSFFCENVVNILILKHGSVSNTRNKSYIFFGKIGNHWIMFLGIWKNMVLENPCKFSFHEKMIML